MTPADMLHLEHGQPNAIPGDCFRACIATLLDLPTADVPHFCDLPDPDTHWIRRTQDWLAERGMFYLNVQTIPWGFLQRNRRPTVIGGGKSPRGTWGHCVVGELTRDGFTILHDPHPSRAGLDGHPDDFGILMRLWEQPHNQGMDHIRKD